MGSYQYFEEYDQQVTDDLKQNFTEILKGVGEDIEREGIVKTPERAAKAIQFLTSGRLNMMIVTGPSCVTLIC